MQCRRWMGWRWLSSPASSSPCWAVIGDGNRCVGLERADCRAPPVRSTAPHRRSHLGAPRNICTAVQRNYRGPGIRVHVLSPSLLRANLISLGSGRRPKFRAQHRAGHRHRPSRVVQPDRAAVHHVRISRDPEQSTISFPFLAGRLQQRRRSLTLIHRRLSLRPLPSFQVANPPCRQYPQGTGIEFAFPISAPSGSLGFTPSATVVITPIPAD